jgi:hypothetical protein
MVVDGYSEYPFHSLPDLGLVDRDMMGGGGPMMIEYGTHATQLSQEHITLIRSAHLWLQAEYFNNNIPPSVRGSYSELWHIMQAVDRLQSSMSTLQGMIQYDGPKHGLIRDHEARYNAAVFAKIQHYPGRYYLPYDTVWHKYFAELNIILKNCAITEADVANLRQKYPHNNDNGGGGGGGRHHHSRDEDEEGPATQRRRKTTTTATTTTRFGGHAF